MTDVGQKRDMNQDYVFTTNQSIGSLPNLFIVADGMGGHNAGDFASKFTVEALVESIKGSKETDPVKILQESIENANEELLKKAQEEKQLSGMGTTLVVATIDKDYLCVANVGDSRLYIIGKVIQQITKDHSLVEEMVRLGEIDREVAKTHPDKNIITRAIGASCQIEIDFFERYLKQGDLVLMCSDGLTNMLEDKEIEFVMKKETSVEEKSEELVNTANINGGKDNIAVVIIEPFSDEVNIC